MSCHCLSGTYKISGHLFFVEQSVHSVVTNVCHLKGKGKLVPVHVVKAYRESRGIAALILNLSPKR
jgi:hypothetical protein